MTTEVLARELFDAERRATPLTPISERHPDLTPSDAYAIQAAYAALRTDHGAQLVGRKIGATSTAIQELFDIDTPDYGHVFDDMVVPNGGAIATNRLIQPMVEPELAFILDRDFAGPGVRGSDVVAATTAILPCLEIIDSRIRDWAIRFVDTVADNGSSARCVFGDPVIPQELRLDEIEAILSKNGSAAATATGTAVLGHPADSVAWLANALGGLGSGLRAGEYVLSGSFTTAFRAMPGDRFEATFSDVGAVSCEFA